MSYQEDIVTAILADAPLTALIGTRIFADAADAKQPGSYLVYQTISVSGETLFDGTRDVKFPLVQFTAWAASKAAAIAITKALATAIEGRDLPGDSNASLSFSNEQSTRDPQTKLFGEIIEFRVSCNS